jgi:hypothetical protein
MARTAGKLKENGAKLTAGAVTAGALKEALKPHLHEKGVSALEKGGFFSRLSGILNVANKAYNAIDKGIKIGTKGVSAYNSFKKASEGMKKPDDVDMEAPKVGMMYGMTKKGAGLRKKKEPKMKEEKPEKPKSKRKLPEALRKRAMFIGEQMRNGKMTMKAASDLYKEMNP